MRKEPNHTRIVADADVLAADLLVGGQARASLDHVRRHSWIDLVVTEPLLDDAEAVITELADAELATDWRERVETWVTVVDQPDGDHPALAAAYRSGAAHVLSMDGTLQSARTGAELKTHMHVSVRSPDAFARFFDPEAAYELSFETPYPGSDRDPRA